MAHQVTAQQLSRLACLYVRQSTLQQVLAHGESTARQYALRERAVALGWPDDQIIVIDIVIDQDLGHSGASMADRLGFQRLVAEVGLGWDWGASASSWAWRSPGGLAAGPQFQRLASLARDLRAHPDPDPGRGWALRSSDLQ